MRIGFENSIPHDININAPAQSIENEVSIISAASLFFFLPLYIENRGVPPLPNKLANAVIITITGKHIPTAPIAVVPICGIRAIYILSTTLYKRFNNCATSIGIDALKILSVIVPFSKSIFFISITCPAYYTAYYYTVLHNIFLYYTYSSENFNFKNFSF